MDILFENQEFRWLAADWLQQEGSRMNLSSAGRTHSLPTAIVRAAFPVVADILSSQPDKQFSLVLPPELGIGRKELRDLESFLTSGKTPSLSLEQTKKMKSFLEDFCHIKVAMSKPNSRKSATTGTVLAEVSHSVATGPWLCVDCQESFDDEQALLDHKAGYGCEEMTVDGDGEEGKCVGKRNTKGKTLEVKQILSRAGKKEGEEEFEVMWKQGKEGSNCET